MAITAIICTRNRAASLERALQSATRLRVPPGLVWELLIVDNGSSDATPAVVASFADRLPIRHVIEPVAGLSHARNRGVTEACGALICWTDDDVELDSDWLAAYHAAACDYPDAAFFGGNVTPVLEGPTSVWFTRIAATSEIQGMMAARCFGADPVALFEGGLLPYGANFAVRTAEQKQHRYDPDLGVSPQHRRSGEETQLILSIIAAGGSGWSVPASHVRHIIPASRQTRRYIWSYYRSQGETWALLSERRAEPNVAGRPSRRRLFGVPVGVGRAAALAWCRSAIYWGLGREAAWLRNRCRAAYYWGATAHLFRLGEARQ